MAFSTFNLSVLLFLLFAGVTFSAESQVRFVHTAFGHGTVESVSVGGTVIGTSLGYSEATELFTFEAGTYEVKTVPLSPATQRQVTFATDTTYTFYFAYNETLEEKFFLTVTANTFQQSSQGKLSLINALVSAPKLEFELFLDDHNSTYLNETLTYAPAEATTLPELIAGNYTAVLSLNGSHLFTRELSVADQISWTVIAMGNATGNSTVLLAFKEADFATTSVVFAHSVYDGLPVSFHLNNDELAKLSFGEASSAFNIQSYATALAVVVANGDTLVTSTLRLKRGSKYYIFLTGTNTTYGLFIHEENPVFNHEKSLVSVGHLIPNAGNLVLHLSPTLNSSLSYETFKSFELQDGQYTVQFFQPSTRRQIRYLKRQGSRGDQKALVSQDLKLDQGSSYLVAAQGSLTDMKLFVVQTSGSNNGGGDDDGLSKGAIAGIIIACIVGAILVVGILVYLYRRKGYESIS